MRLLACSLLLISMSQSLYAQPATLQPGMQPAAKPKAEENDVAQVVIKRDAIQMMNPTEFQVSISLSPIRLLEVRANVDGIIQNVRVKAGEKVKAQAELLQIDSEYAGMVLELAQAKLQAAKLRSELVSKEVAAGKQNQIALDLTKSEIKLAEAELKIAQYNIENMSIRAAFSGQVQIVSAIPGALIHKGDLLLTMVDTSQLTAQIPVDRTKTKQGATIEIQLDNKKAKGVVQSILPLKGKWEPLRKIFDTASLAIVVIENSTDEFQDGQTVYSSIVPRSAVIEVPNLALKNSETGTRIIQVVRDSMIRDIEVQLLGPVGEGRSYVSGALQENDELIKESSQALADGSFIRPATFIEQSDEKSEKPGAKPITKPVTPF